MYGVGIVLNAIFPVCEGVFSIWLLIIWDATTQTPQPLENCLSASIICTSLVQIIAGITLISAILKIQKYLKNNGKNQVNNQLLTLHSVSFFLFMISIVVLAVSEVIMIHKDFNPKESRFSLITAIITKCVSFVSQIILCVIIWQLSNQHKLDGEVETAEFDEEAALQARLWNQFIRCPKGSHSEIDSFITCSSSIKESVQQDNEQRFSTHQVPRVPRQSLRVAPAMIAKRNSNRPSFSNSTRYALEFQAKRLSQDDLLRRYSSES